MSKSVLLSVLFLIGMAGYSAHADTTISGYGSIAVGKVISGDKDPSGETEFQTDFNDYAFYTETMSWKPDTMFALQLYSDVGDNLSFVGQIVTKGADEFKPELDWLYAKYNLSDDLYVMVGRRSLPMYYFSEYLEVAYAYPWVRPPAMLYWWDMSQFNGITVGKTMQLSNEWMLQINGFTGREERKNLTSHDYWRPRGGYYYPPTLYAPPTGYDGAGVVPTTAKVVWDDILGVNFNVSNDWIDLRFSVFSNHYETTTEMFYTKSIDTNNDGTPDTDIIIDRNPDGSPIISDNWAITSFDMTFYGVSGTFNFEMATVLFDYNYVVYDDGYQFRFPNYMISAVYNHPTWQPYVSISHAKGEINEEFDGFGTGASEESQMLSLGIRYNFHSNAALKLQYDSLEDLGDQGWYDFSYHNDASLVTVSLDFVF
jgi:hypothetical protein